MKTYEGTSGQQEDVPIFGAAWEKRASFNASGWYAPPLLTSQEAIPFRASGGYATIEEAKQAAQHRMLVRLLNEKHTNEMPYPDVEYL